MEKLKSSRAAKSAHGFVLGSNAMMKLNAVEGIKTSDASRKMFREFEHGRVNAEDRRRTVIAKHSVKG